jgi:hypothetical protein
MPAVLLCIIGNAFMHAMVVPAKGQQNPGRFCAHNMNLSGQNRLGKPIWRQWRIFNDECRIARLSKAAFGVG